MSETNAGTVDEESEEGGGIVYPTLDPLAKGVGIALSNGNLTATHDASGWKHVRCTLGKLISEGGIWYWEHTVDFLPGVTQMAGIGNNESNLSSYVGQTIDSCGILDNSGSGLEFYSSSSAIVFGTVVQGSVVMHEINLTANTYRQGVDGTWGGYVTRGFPASVAGNQSVPPGLIYPVFGWADIDVATVNFGQNALSHFGQASPGANAGWFSITP